MAVYLTQVRKEKKKDKELRIIKVYVSFNWLHQVFALGITKVFIREPSQ